MRVCPICGTTSPLTNRHCPECGGSFDAPVAHRRAEPAAAPVSSAGAHTSNARSGEILQPGTVLNGRYRLARVLGSGAFGRVYLAEDAGEPNHMLAIKELLATDFSSSEEQRDAINWFKREVSTLLTLDHPGIPAIHGYWTAHSTSGPLYLAMDYIPGKTLAEIQAELDGRVPRQQVVGWGIGLCDVLSYLHSRTPPFVFRDLKPANVLVHATTGRPVLIDFGLARQIVAVGGTAVGTWGYVPFEQVLGRAEARSDIYALGAMMHCLLSGRQPDVEYRRALRNGMDLEHALCSLFPPLDTLVPGIPPALSQVILTATAYDLEDRFGSAVEMAAALRIALAAPGGIVAMGPVDGPGRAGDAVTAAVEMQSAERGLDGEEPPSSHRLARGPRLAGSDSGAVRGIERAPLRQPPTAPVTAATPLAGIPSSTGASGGVGVSTIVTTREDGHGQRRRWRAGTGTGTSSLPEISATDRLVVSAAGDGQYVSIAEAIQHAAPGARIEVRTGRYVECLVIDRPIEIVGVGPVDEVIVESTGASCLLMQADAAIVRGLTMRLKPAMQGGDRYYAVNVPMGRLLLEDCQVISNSLACVAIHGKGTSPIVRHCLLHNPIERAVAVYDFARGLIEECEIIGGTLPVRVSSHANPTFRQCLIHGGSFGGVGVAEQGRGRFDECDIVENGHHGVSVRQASRVTLWRCLISRNGWNAVSVADNSGATVEHCDLTGNRRTTWDVKDTARPQVEMFGNKET